MLALIAPLLAEFIEETAFALFAATGVALSQTVQLQITRDGLHFHASFLGVIFI